MKESEDLATKLINRIKHEYPGVDIDAPTLSWREVVSELCEQNIANVLMLRDALNKQKDEHEKQLFSVVAFQQKQHDAALRVLGNALNEHAAELDALTAALKAESDEAQNMNEDNEEQL